jgi:hypothetical protein
MMRRKVVWGTAATVLAVAAGALVLHLTRATELVGGPSPGGPRVPLDQVDHSAYDALLQRYVDDQGQVAYARWKASPADLKALDDYLGRLSAVDRAAPAGKPAQLAFWINAYNALTLKGVLMKYPLRSIKDHVSYVPGQYNIWRDLLLWVDGEKTSLENIEHKVLRKLSEPRIHFAIVCASKGCPPLRSEAYTAAKLEEQLADNTRRFFARPSNFRAEEAEGTVHVSQLIGWFDDDFGATQADRLRLLRPYFPAQDKLGWLDGANVDLLPDLEYDWLLNDQE